MSIMPCMAVAPATLRLLRNLVARDLGSAQGLSRAADWTRNPALARTLRACAVVCEEFASELRSVLRALGDIDALPAPCRARRWWLELEAVAELGGDHALLNEVIRAESAIRECYDAAQREPVADELSEVVQRQAECIRRIELHLRLLRQIPRVP